MTPTVDCTAHVCDFRDCTMHGAFRVRVSIPSSRTAPPMPTAINLCSTHHAEHERKGLLYPPGPVHARTEDQVRAAVRRWLRTASGDLTPTAEAALSIQLVEPPVRIATALQQLRALQAPELAGLEGHKPVTPSPAVPATPEAVEASPTSTPEPPAKEDPVNSKTEAPAVQLPNEGTAGRAVYDALSDTGWKPSALIALEADVKPTTTAASLGRLVSTGLAQRMKLPTVADSGAKEVWWFARAHAPDPDATIVAEKVVPMVRAEIARLELRGEEDATATATPAATSPATPDGAAEVRDQASDEQATTPTTTEHDPVDLTVEGHVCRDVVIPLVEAMSFAGELGTKDDRERLRAILAEGLTAKKLADMRWSELCEIHEAHGEAKAARDAAVNEFAAVRHALAISADEDPVEHIRDLREELGRLRAAVRQSAKASDLLDAVRTRLGVESEDDIDQALDELRSKAEACDAMNTMAGVLEKGIRDMLRQLAPAELWGSYDGEALVRGLHDQVRALQATAGDWRHEADQLRDTQLAVMEAAGVPEGESCDLPALVRGLANSSDYAARCAEVRDLQRKLAQARSPSEVEIHAPCEAHSLGIRVSGPVVVQVITGGEDDSRECEVAHG